MYEVYFYKDHRDCCPTVEFLDTIPVNTRAKVLKWISYLEKEGPNLPRPYADIVQDKIRELRISFGSNEYRFFYFFFGKKIIITHGFTKKTQHIPQREIDQAIRYMNNFLQRNN